jgi:hypothetical protein
VTGFRNAKRCQSTLANYFMTAPNTTRYYSAAANLSRIDKREDTDVLNRCVASALPHSPSP